MQSEIATLELDGQEAGLVDLASFMQELHNKWTPHPGQVPLGKALFYDGFKDIFAQCGRNFGKTEFIAYAVWRYGFEHPRSENYIFGPIQKQIKEILWASGRIQGLGPQEYLSNINNVEMRIIFSCGSFVKLDGSDNVDAYRGIKPKGLSVYDEIKDMRKNFLDAYDPNRAAFDSPAIYIGTPPEFHNHFVDLSETAKRNHGDTWFYLHAPTATNPYISARWLAKKKKELLDLGEEETWLREYEAIFVKGSKRTIFPQFLRLSFLPFDKPIDLNKWILISTYDPAASSVFGVLFALFNPYSKRVIIFDEVYESDPNEMTSRKIYARVEEKLKAFKGKVREIRWCYDEAAKYFQSEIYSIPGNDWQLEPSQKSKVGINGYIGIARSVLSRNLVTVTDNCVKFRWEMENYMKDENGRIPKDNDHLINCFQYKLQALGFNLDEESEPKPEDPFLSRRFMRLEDEFQPNNNLVDFDSEPDQNLTLEDLD